MKMIASDDLFKIQGGCTTAQDIMNTTCAIVGVGAWFVPGGQFAGAFCAGWSLGYTLWGC